MIDTRKSSSHEQQKAEVFIADMVEEWLGCHVERNAKVFFLKEYILSQICILKKIE